MKLASLYSECITTGAIAYRPIAPKKKKKLSIIESKILAEDLFNDGKRNLELAGLFDEDSDYGGMLGKSVLNLLKEFCGNGHSGCSAMLTTEIFNKLVKGEPLTSKYWDEKAVGLREFAEKNGEGVDPEEYVIMCIGERPDDKSDVVEESKQLKNRMNTVWTTFTSPKKKRWYDSFAAKNNPDERLLPEYRGKGY